MARFLFVVALIVVVAYAFYAVGLTAAVEHLGP